MTLSSREASLPLHLECANVHVEVLHSTSTTRWGGDDSLRAAAGTLLRRSPTKGSRCVVRARLRRLGLARDVCSVGLLRQELVELARVRQLDLDEPACVGRAEEVSAGTASDSWDVCVELSLRCHRRLVECGATKGARKAPLLGCRAEREPVQADAPSPCASMLTRSGASSSSALTSLIWPDTGA